MEVAVLTMNSFHHYLDLPAFRPLSTPPAIEPRRARSEIHSAKFKQHPMPVGAWDGGRMGRRRGGISDADGSLAEMLKRMSEGSVVAV